MSDKNSSSDNGGYQGYGKYGKFMSLGYLKAVFYGGLAVYLVWDRWTRPKGGKTKKERDKEKNRETFVDASLRSAEERMGIIEYRLRQIEEREREREQEQEQQEPEQEQEEQRQHPPLARSAADTIRQSGRRVRARDRLQAWQRNRDRSQQSNENHLHDSLLKLYAHPSLRDN